MNITYDLTGEVFEIKDLNQVVHIVKLTCPCTRKDLESLIGSYLFGSEIVGIKSFAIENQSYKTIGIAVRK